MQPYLYFVALVLSASALAVSAAGNLVADRSDARLQRREDAEYAQQVVHSFEQQMIFGLPGDKPSMEGGTVVLVNFGTFPVQEVVLEQTKRPSQLLVETIPAVRGGALRPCLGRDVRERPGLRSRCLC